MSERERSANTNDAGLRDRFAALRSEELKIAPEFSSSWRGKPRVPRRRWRGLVVTACALVVLLAVLWLKPERDRGRPSEGASITEWKAPTDFLLQTPGREFLRTVPQFGAWPASKAVTAPSSENAN